MAKRKINKSEAIRMYLKDHPDAGPKQVGNALKKKRITVQPALVSNVKANLRRKSGEVKPRLNGPRRGRPSKASLVNVDDLVLAREFCRRVGGIEAARVALDAIAKLQ
jgi:hypothetical protein